LPPAIISNVASAKESKDRIISIVSVVVRIIVAWIIRYRVVYEPLPSFIIKIEEWLIWVLADMIDRTNTKPISLGQDFVLAVYTAHPMTPSMRPINISVFSFLFT